MSSSVPSRLATNLSAGKPQTLVVYGTSLTFNAAAILKTALKEKFGDLITFVNSGLSGRASRTGLEQLEEKVLAYNPDTVLIEFAVNDAHTYFHEPDALDAGIDLAESERNLETMIERIQSRLPDCEIIIQTMNPSWDSPANDRNAGSNRPGLADFYEAYRRVAERHGLRLIDNHEAWTALHETDAAQFEAYVADGVHPTPTAVRQFQVPNVLKELGF